MSAVAEIGAKTGETTVGTGETIAETATAVTLGLDVADWPGHRAGQHVDVRLTAEDGYSAQRSYSIASPPGADRLELTVVRLDDGEVSPYLTTALDVGDQLELRGPIGGYFVWEAMMTEPWLLIAGGSGVVPLMSMIRHRAAAGVKTPTSLHSSSRNFEDVIYSNELEKLQSAHNGASGLQIFHTLTRSQPPAWKG